MSVHATGRGGTHVKPGRSLLSTAAALFLLTLTAQSARAASSPAPARHGASAHLVTARAMGMHVVNERAVPAAPARLAARSSHAAPFLGSLRPGDYARAKATAASLLEPRMPHPFAPPPRRSPASARTFAGTPPLSQGFSALSYDGWWPPDQALATSPDWVLEGVNSAVAVYATNGALAPGWPKTAQAFFGVQAPSPAGCAPAANLFDPRAFYDPTTQRFFALIDEVEGTDATPRCSFVSRYWIAVSQTSDPTGAWNVFWVDMSQGPGYWADFPGFGFNDQAIFFSGNVFLAAGSSSSFQDAEVYEANKAAIEAGSLAFSVSGFTGLTDPLGSPAFAVQPVADEAPAGAAPSAGLLVSSQNCSSPCSGLTLWAFNNPIAHDSGGPAPTLTAASISSPSYFVPPNADEPGCAGCIDTGDTRISATPVYANGAIWGALGTDVNNGTQDVAGILWFELQPLVDTSGNVSGSVARSGDFGYVGDMAAVYPSLVVDAEGDVAMTFEAMSSSIDPSAAYAVLPAGASDFPDGGNYLWSGGAPYDNSANESRPWRWGDYSAASYAGQGTDQLWFAAEYANPSGRWGTAVGMVSPTPLPTASVSVSPNVRFQGGQAFSIGWAGDALASSFNVQAQGTPWSGGSSAWTPAATGVAAGDASFTGVPGTTYCFEVQGVSASGQQGLWSRPTCTSIPLDDRALSAKGSWARRTGSGYYLGTYTQSSTLGAALVRTSVRGKRFSLVAATCPRCGTIAVYLGRMLVRRVSLYSSSFRKDVVFTLAAFSWTRAGTVTIRIVSSGRPVMIDGLGVSSA